MRQEKSNQIFHRLIRFVCRYRLQLAHDRMLGVEFHGLSGNHAGRHGIVSQCPGLRDTLHVCVSAMLRSGRHTWRVGHTAAYKHLLDFVTRTSFTSFIKGSNSAFIVSIFVPHRILIIHAKTLLGGGLQANSFNCCTPGSSKGANHVQHLKSLLARTIQQG